MKIRSDHLRNGIVTISFLIVLLPITSYRSKEDNKKESPVVEDDLTTSEFTFHSPPLLVNVALRRIAIKLQ